MLPAAMLLILICPTAASPSLSCPAGSLQLQLQATNGLPSKHQQATKHRKNAVQHLRACRVRPSLRMWLLLSMFDGELLVLLLTSDRCLQAGKWQGPAQ